MFVSCSEYKCYGTGEISYVHTYLFGRRIKRKHCWWWQLFFHEFKQQLITWSPEINSSIPVSAYLLCLFTVETFSLLSSHALAVQHNNFPVMAINIQDKYKVFIDHIVLNLYCYSKQKCEKKSLPFKRQISGFRLVGDVRSSKELNDAFW